MNQVIAPKHSLRGTLQVPGDKSISHRAVMFGAIAQGTTEIEGFLNGEDCLSTVSCFQSMGISIQIKGTSVLVEGKGLHGLAAPSDTLYVGNSGTTLRLLSGILSAQPFTSHLTGDASIQKRPMDRVVLPLSLMGAKIQGTGEEKVYAPLTIAGSKLKGITYTLPVASAQVKSAILLASLYAEDETIIVEPQASRNHTEIMLNYFGAKIKKEGNQIFSCPVSQLYANQVKIAGDISSAAYFIAAAVITKQSELLIENVNLNPTRTGILQVLKQMGADISLHQQREVCGEMVGDILVRSSILHGVCFGGDIIPTLIDEIPIIAVCACFAQGDTVISNAEELKVKESNRIKTVVEELSKLGADIEETEDGMIIHGGTPLKGAVVESHQDHRIAMSLSIAALACQGETTICQAECVDISFPYFYQQLQQL